MKKKVKIIIIVLIVLIIIYIYTFKLCIFKKHERFSDTSPKFFHELSSFSHLDKRFGKPNLKIKHIQNSLINVLMNFMLYCKINDIKPILMYGGLIGYYFNQELLPWDDDIDMILTEPYISRLKNYDSDDWLIEINPNSSNYSKSDLDNIVSARVISKETGAFIDIVFHTEIDNMLHCKDGNVYDKDDIYPLQESKFYDIDIYVPNKIESCLIQRYGDKVLLPKYKDWEFNSKYKVWLQDDIEEVDFSSLDKKCKYQI